MLSAETIKGMTLVDGCLAFSLLTDKEQSLRAFTEGMALAVCAEVVDGGSGYVRRAARGMPRSMRMWLDVILVTMCSTGERSASAEYGDKGGAGRAGRACL